MRRSYALTFLGVAGLAMPGCAPPWRRQPALPPCNEAQANALDTTRWRTVDAGPYPSLILPAEFREDERLVIICYHGGVTWVDSTALTATRRLRFIGWCHEDGMPRTDAPDSVVRRLPARPMKRSYGQRCQLSFQVFGQRMALLRQFRDTVVGYEWITWPLDHGEPSYLLARSPFASDEAMIIRALQRIRWTR